MSKKEEGLEIEGTPDYEEKSEKKEETTAEEMKEHTDRKLNKHKTTKAMRWIYSN